MIKVEKIDVNGFEAAIRGMRNPMNSWDRSDSYMGYDCHKCGRIDREGICEPKKHDCSEYYGIEIGKNDLDLMRRLYKAGTEHRKYLRMIHVTMDVTAPLYWWKEYDTYKVSTVANSCSTMHKIHAKEFTLDDFSTDHLTPVSMECLNIIIDHLNVARNYFINTKDKAAWWQMIQLLPTSYNQKRTLDLSYETIINIIHQRTGHKLDEWNLLVEELKKLPYLAEIMNGEE